MEGEFRMKSETRSRGRWTNLVGMVLIGLILIVPPSIFGKTGDVVAIKAGHIVTVTGGVIENGTIIIRNGLIQAVGKDLVIPPGAEIVQEDTMYVYPGLIDAHSSLALKKAEQKDQPTQPGGQSARGPTGPSPTMMSPVRARLVQACLAFSNCSSVLS